MGAESENADEWTQTHNFTEVEVWSSWGGREGLGGVPILDLGSATGSWLVLRSGSAQATGSVYASSLARQIPSVQMMALSDGGSSGVRTHESGLFDLWKR